MRRSYEDFKPFCRWNTDEEQEVFEVHLHGFKKAQLKVQLNNLGTMIITGERPTELSKWIRFRQEIKVPGDCPSNLVHAKLSNGILNIFMPRKLPPPQYETTTTPPQEINNSDEVIKTPSENPNIVNQGMVQGESSLIATKPTSSGKAILGLKGFAMRFKIDRNVDIKLGVLLSLLAGFVLVAMLIYKLRQPLSGA